MNSIQIVLLIATLLTINSAVWLGVIFLVRRKYPLPARLESPDPISTATEIFPGYYLCTMRCNDQGEVARFYGWHLLTRGNGNLYLTERGLHFLRRGGRRPLWIPIGNFTAVQAVVSKRLKIRGRLSMEVDWELAGFQLRSVFVLGGGVSITRRVADWIEARIQ